MRRFAAIMFTDIVGYTALMGADEQKAFNLLRQNRRIHKRLINKHSGKWLKEMGDGILASFQTSYLGEKQLKNVADTVKVYQIQVDESDGREGLNFHWSMLHWARMKRRLKSC